jgi:hypothetical protein
MTEASKQFEDDIRAAAQRRSAATVVVSDGEESPASKAFSRWIRGEGAPSGDESTHEDSIDDASRPDSEPTDVSERFSEWARGDDAAGQDGTP